jgi:hypothetical protein
MKEFKKIPAGYMFGVPFYLPFQLSGRYARKYDNILNPKITQNTLRLCF